MTIDSILNFWSHNNTLIIEVLLGVVIVSSLFLAFRSFYGAKEEATAEANGHASGTNLDTAQLEKTLQKILENQSNNGTRGVDFASGSESVPVVESTGDFQAEATQLRGALNDSARKIELLQAQLAEAQTAAASAAANASSGGGGDAGLTSAERDDLNGKIRDLEARLAEYEIISEDIADLSRYREENDDLRKQLEDLKARLASAPAAPAAAPAPSPAAAPASPTPPQEPVAPPVAAAVPDAPAVSEPDPFDAVAANLEQEIAAAELNAAAQAMASQEPNSSEPAAPAEDASQLIDDELMKEFAAAVEGQKNLSKVSAKAGDASTPPEAAKDDTDKLMNQFEDFVTKKS